MLHLQHSPKDSNLHIWNQVFSRQMLGDTELWYCFYVLLLSFSRFPTPQKLLCSCNRSRQKHMCQRLWCCWSHLCRWHVTCIKTLHQHSCVQPHSTKHCVLFFLFSHKSSVQGKIKDGFIAFSCIQLYTYKWYNYTYIMYTIIHI